MLALFQVAYTRIKVNVLLLDEALDTLDTAGLDNVVEVLNSFAKEMDLTIYVTSHTDLNQRLFESIVVHKEDGQSTCYVS
jgi:DNA repair exonuclease SbcCD ATPase subunit